MKSWKVVVGNFKEIIRDLIEMIKDLEVFLVISFAAYSTSKVLYEIIISKLT
jgi:hypothetical protein